MVIGKIGVLADFEKGGDMMDRLGRLRKYFASEMGLILPPVRVRDSLELNQTEYEFCINGYSIVKGSVIPDRYLAIETDKVKEDLFRNPESILSSETAFFDKIVTECYGAGREKILPINTIAPIYGKPALWIDENIKMQAQIHGYMVLEPSAVIMAHFQEMIRQHADSFFPEKA